MGRLTKSDLKKILSRHGAVCGVYIETGTRWGTQVAIAADVFDEAHGIELNQHCYEKSRDTLLDRKNVTMHLGDSRKVLPEVASKVLTPAFFLFDAHYCRIKPPIPRSEFPLWDELRLVRDRGFADIVVVDDAHNFGKSRDDLRYSPDAIEWEAVTPESVTGFFGDRVRDSEIMGGGLVVWLSGKSED